MSAVFTAIGSIVQSGDHIVAGRALFGSTHQLLTRVFPKWGVTHSYVDGDSPDTWAAALTPATKLIFVETPSNPGLDLVDLEALGALARARGIPLLVDNCFSTPILQQPLRQGASLVIHSATKFIDGQGRTLGGAIVGDAKLVAEARYLARHSGPALSPFNAWVLSKSLETLSLRMEKHCANALRVASHFEGHAAVQRVRYPHLPSHPQYALARRQMSLGGGVLTLQLADYATARRKPRGHAYDRHAPDLDDALQAHRAGTSERGNHAGAAADFGGTGARGRYHRGHRTGALARGRACGGASI
jgi:O-succinylhomoserine sulfhydrylase